MSTVKTQEKRSEPGTALIVAMRSIVKDRPITTFHYSDRWNNLRGLVKEMIKGVSNGSLSQVPTDLLALWQDDYKTAVEYYLQLGMEPVFIRWGNTVVVFNTARLPNIVKQSLEDISKGLVTPEPDPIKEFIEQYPFHVGLAFTGKYVLPVFINDQLFVIDTTIWSASNINVDHLNSYTLFNDRSGWR